MRIRDWQDIVEDVTEKDVDPDGWRAVGGTRSGGVGEDLYLGHPTVGVFHLKTYAKNPYELKGVGTQIARKVDGDVDSLLPRRDDSTGRFAVRGAPEDEDHAKSMAKRLAETLKVHADAPTTRDDLFSDVMDAIDSPAFGPMEFEPSERPERLEKLSTTFEDAEDVLEAELDDLVERDEIGRGFQ